MILIFKVLVLITGSVELKTVSKNFDVFTFEDDVWLQLYHLGHCQPWIKQNNLFQLNISSTSFILDFSETWILTISIPNVNFQHLNGVQTFLSCSRNECSKFIYQKKPNIIIFLHFSWKIINKLIPIKFDHTTVVYNEIR